MVGTTKAANIISRNIRSREYEENVKKSDPCQGLATQEIG